MGGEKQAELFKDIIWEQMGFIKDQERDAVFVEEQIIQRQADAGDHFRAGEGRLMTKGSQEIAVETGETEEGIGEVDDKEAVGVEGGGKAAQSGGFSAAGLAGDQTHAALLGQIVRRAQSSFCPSAEKRSAGGISFAKGVRVKP